MAPVEATRRQLTVLCCELVEASRLSQQFDPEELRDLVRAYQSMCQTVMQRFEGEIVQNSGMGLVAYFGYPQAREDAAYRAVRAGLGMVHELSTLNHLFHRDADARLSIRVGLHTGLVVAEPPDQQGPQTPVAIGAPPHVAAQIQSLAEPDAVWISAATAELVQGFFVCREDWWNGKRSSAY